MFLYYISLILLPLGSLISLFTSLWKKENRDKGDTLTCKSFNSIYFLLDEAEMFDARMQKIKRGFLQKSWGITRYQDAMVKVDADYSDLLYASLGALKDLDAGHYPEFYEQSVQGIIDNNLAIKSVEKIHPKYEFESDLGIFRPRAATKPEQALAIVSALSILTKSGSNSAKTLLHDLIWKKLYILFLLFPNYGSIEENAVGYIIINKTSTGFLRLMSSVFLKINSILAYLNRNYPSLVLIKSMENR